MPQISPTSRGTGFIAPNCLLDEILHVGWGLHTHALAKGLEPHRHPGAYEICYIASGGVEWWAESSVYEVNRGEIYVTHPGELHGGVNAVMHPCELYWIQIAFPHEQVLAGLTLRETKALARDFSTIQLRSFPGSPGIAHEYDRILAEHQQPTEYSLPVVRSALHGLLIRVLRHYRAYVKKLETRSTRSSRSPHIQRALEWMENHLTDSYRVEDMAHVAGMSTSYFQKQFRREVGFTPAEYRTRQRIDVAKGLLNQSTLSITEIAFRLGFSSSQYFATVFRKLEGTTPTTYRERRQEMGQS